MNNIFLNNMPSTEYGASLKLTEEQEKQCKMVYKRSENKPDIYTLYGVWDGETDYSQEHIILPLRSVLEGTEAFLKGTAFANVEGSKDDPKVAGMAWRQLLKNQNVNYTCCCAELNTIYDSDDNSKIRGFACTNGGKEKYDPSGDWSKGIYMQGAHVIMGSTSSGTVDAGKTVNLLALCKEHNIYNHIGSWGAGYYMKLKADTTTLKLKSYMQVSAALIASAQSL